MPIALEPDDEFYSQFDQGCMNFVRSALAPDGHCELSYGKQVKKSCKSYSKLCEYSIDKWHLMVKLKISKVTHFIDASVIYGSDAEKLSEVRSFQGGRLRMLDDFGRQLLPLTVDKKTCVSLDKGPCFFTGNSILNYTLLFYDFQVWAAT